MISFEELKIISQTRLEDAKALLINGRYDGALYVCGYAVETALKSIVCKNLNLNGVVSSAHIPSTTQEFKIIELIKTHDLEGLLKLAPANLATEIKTTKLSEWSTVLKWNPEMRYAPIRGAAMQVESTDVVNSAESILQYLWTQI
ncbi:MAG TPA: HEPN domain-containing protein [Candidatus Udaeobacter sp.]|nr:HEPN domain-containing protein [Candidatus Udaeobacter sp.]